MKEESIPDEIKESLSERELKSLEFANKLNELVLKYVKEIPIVEVIGHLQITLLNVFELGKELGNVIMEKLKKKSEANYIG